MPIDVCTLGRNLRGTSDTKKLINRKRILTAINGSFFVLSFSSHIYMSDTPHVVSSVFPSVFNYHYCCRFRRRRCCCWTAASPSKTAVNGSCFVLLHGVHNENPNWNSLSSLKLFSHTWPTDQLSQKAKDRCLY